MEITPGGAISEHQVNYSRSSRHSALWLSAKGLPPSQGSWQTGPSLPVIEFRALTAKAADNIPGFPPTISQPGKWVETRESSGLPWELVGFQLGWNPLMPHLCFIRYLLKLIFPWTIYLPTKSSVSSADQLLIKFSNFFDNLVSKIKRQQEQSQD